MKYLALMVFALGAGVLAWMATALAGTHPLALAVIVVIASGYLVGMAELALFSRDTAALSRVLATAKAEEEPLDTWLARLPESLRHGVRLRIRGEPGALPAPVLTPYLTGLLVMLGLLGTFIGMVATLQGAVLALEGTTELDAIRRGLTAPIKGLSMAFGTSVAGVAASAALGFVATLCRRQRLAALKSLDVRADSNFRSDSLAGYRDQVLATLQEQTRLLPDLVAQMAGQSRGLTTFAGELDARLVSGQERFHQQILEVHRELATSLDHSLRESLATSGRLAGESMRPLVDETMAALTSAAAETRRAVEDSTRTQLAEISGQLRENTGELNSRWLTGLNQVLEGFDNLQSTAAEAAAREAHLREEQQRLATRTEELIESLHAGAGEQRREASAQGAQLAERFSHLADALARRGDEQGTRLLEAQRELNGDLAGRYAELADRVQTDSEQQRETGAAQTRQLLTRLSDVAEQVAAHSRDQESRLADSQRDLSSDLAGRYRELADDITRHLADAADNQSRRTLEVLQPLVQETLSAVAGHAEATREAVTRSTETQAAALTTQLREVTDTLQQRWSTALDHQQQAGAGFLERIDAAIGEIHQRFNDSAGQLLATVDELRASAAASLEREAASSTRQQSLAEDFAAVTDTVKESVAHQQHAVEQLTENASRLLADVAERADQQIAAGSGRLSAAAEDFTTGSAELASLGEALLQVVSGFGNANEQLRAAAGQLEAAVAAAAERSDEQMGYYIAQAREVIDHSVLAQQELIDQMRQLSQTA